VTELVADRTVPALKLEEFLPDRLAMLSSIVARALSQLYASHDLSKNEWIMLVTLARYGEMTAKNLGLKNRMHKTKVSRIVATLLARGFISRRSNHADLRQSLLHLTPLGKQVLEACTPLAADLAKHLEDAIAVTDRDAFDRCLTKLTARSEELFSAGARRRGG
jgi:DNA-binding MarR family transcriptional regulator